MAGRGAYLCPGSTCLEKALKRNLIKKHLEIAPDAETTASLLTVANECPED